MHPDDPRCETPFATRATLVVEIAGNQVPGYFFLRSIVAYPTSIAVRSKVSTEQKTVMSYISLPPSLKLSLNRSGTRNKISRNDVNLMQERTSMAQKPVTFIYN